MTTYETLFIVHPDQGGQVKEFIGRFKEIVEGLGGEVSHVDEWGPRDLAYQIKKQSKGHYVLLQHRSTTRVVEELERQMKLSDGILRYLTVRLDEEARPKEKESPEGAAGGSAEESVKPEPPS